ncbi:hypothetical protein [Pseudomonas phage vB_PaeM_PS119XW]|uniref:Uncharacterized protein n=1 Tax=Pseudomonas phage vB_PaeM_PS119XW TaxID=2601632 RepID=A0A5C1K7G1_9CAUD|nr:hypothetical protein PP933_gp147 [Pseudomonas phage vB_PaeM_PS119XW]QEM41876.1 hypothetical protein [Pseudomonas phage vB_PaeM_PS119XW]
MKFEKLPNAKFRVTISFEEMRQRMAEGLRRDLALLGKERVEAIVEHARTLSQLYLWENSSFVKKNELLMSGMELGHPNVIVSSPENMILRGMVIDANRVCATIDNWHIRQGNSIDTSHALILDITSAGPLARDMNALYDLLPLAVGFRYQLNEREQVADIVGVDILYKDDFDNPVFKDK